jgi:prevent-host-death family protein
VDEVPEVMRAEEARTRFADLLDATQYYGRVVRIVRRRRVAGVLVPEEVWERAQEALKAQEGQS